MNSVQEEVGLRGAEMISRRIKPNLAIVTDVCHDTQTPMYEKKLQGDQKAGLGPVLTYGPAVHNNVLQMIIDTANERTFLFSVLQLQERQELIRMLLHTLLRVSLVH